MSQKFVYGLPDIKQMIEGLPLNIQKNVVRGLMIDIARKAAKQAVTFLEQNGSVRTGNLRDSIKARRTRGTKEEITSVVETDVFYAKFIEFGTSKLSAKPFLTPAADMAEKELVEQASEKVAELIEKQLAKMKKKFGS